MKILSTALLLLFTLIVVPIVSYYFGTAPGAHEWQLLHRLLLVAGIAALVCFVLGEATGNNSQVDKLWSLLPIAYTWMVADAGGYSARLVLMAMLATIWGIRLTANFALKGAYQWKFWTGEEDYRWQVLRQKPEFRPRWKWTLFNLFFISLYQNLLILAFTLPAVVALQFNDRPLGTWDIVATIAMLFFIGYETIADIQQWRFQSTKNHTRPASCEAASGHGAATPITSPSNRSGSAFTCSPLPPAASGSTGRSPAACCWCCCSREVLRSPKR
jgi:steroid 5-alpha reductase family enzyme